MTLRTIFAPFLALALILMGLLAFAPSAQAACSYNGFVNSGGNCGVSYRSGPMYYPYTYQYQYQFMDRYYEDREDVLQAFIDYLEDLIEQLEDQLDETPYDSGRSDVSVTTLSATDVDDDRATLRGRVYTGNEDEVTVYFEYGRSRSDLDEDTSHRVIDDPSNTYNFSTILTNLRDDTVYYYRAVAEDEDGDEDYGSIYSFRTDDGRSSSRDDEPDADTRSASDITDDSAELRGIVDMNDFDDGIVFFVYGEDEDQIEDVEDDYDTYNEIDEDGDDLQKVRVDSDLDGSDSYNREVDGLDDDTRIYYSICVEFEDEDDDETLVCGDVESFTTDD